ncbi:hypothetical protein [Lysobacter sp. P5_B9]
MGMLLTVKRGIATLALYVFAGAAAAADYPETMQFEVFQPCLGTATFCAPQILARGTFDDEAAIRLLQLLVAEPAARTVAFDSPGGSLTSGLAIGRLIRAMGLNTRIASSYEEEAFATDGASTEFRVVAKDAVCFSACAYAFMGGVSRTLEEEGRYGVHQFFGGQSETSQADTQVAVAMISQYMKEMGVDRELLDVASLTSADGITEVPRSRAIQYRLDNTLAPLARWEVRALEDGQSVVGVRQQIPGGDKVEVVGIGLAPDQPTVALVLVRLENVPDSIDVQALTSMLPLPGAFGRLCSNVHCALLRQGPQWEWQDGVLQGAYTAIPTELLQLAQGDELRLELDFPIAASEVDPSLTFGTEGFRQSMLNLMR